MLNRIRTWLIFKLVGDQPVIMNIDVTLDRDTSIVDKTFFLKKSKVTVVSTIQV